jgi:hypothetical protein
MDMNREIPRPPNTKRVKRQVQKARLAAKQSQKRGRILTTSCEKEYGSYEGKAQAVKGLGLLLGVSDKCYLSSPKIIAAALLFALTLLIPSTIGKLAKICLTFIQMNHSKIQIIYLTRENSRNLFLIVLAIYEKAKPWSTGVSKAKWKDLIKETSTYRFDYSDSHRRPARSLLNIIEKDQIVCVGCQSVVECRLLAKVIQEVDDLNSAEFLRFRKNLEIRLEADSSAVFFPATHLGEIPDGSQSRQRKRSSTDQRSNDRNDLSKNELSYLVLMTTGDNRFHDSTCDARVLYETKFVNFEVSVSWLMFSTITASVHVKATNQTAQKCPRTTFMVIGNFGLDGSTYYADQTLWLDRTGLASLVGFTSLEMMEYRECLWPKGNVFGQSETISRFIPLEIGGPPAATNTIPGYGTQNRCFTFH